MRRVYFLNTNRRISSWSSVWRLRIPNFTSFLFWKNYPWNFYFLYKLRLVFLLQPRRLSFGGFGTLRKKRQDDGEEFVCPMNVEMPKSGSFQRGRVQIYEENLDHLEQVRTHTFFFLMLDSTWSVSPDHWLDVCWQMEDSEGTVRQIGAFSEGINNLTVRRRAAAASSSSEFIFWRSSLCFRACWRTTSSSRRSPSALLKSTTLLESLWFVGKPASVLCGRTRETFLQPELSFIYWSCPAFISVFKYVCFRWGKHT